jgi:divalent metal cation (Fe/Co/Zn/Cd) transporter
MAIYRLLIIVIMPAFISFIVNLHLFKYVHSSSRRIQAHNDTAQAISTKISGRDLSLLRHTVFMFVMFFIGWSAIFLLVAIDYSGNVIPLVYTILQVLAVISFLSCMVDLFLYNHELRQYIKQKMFLNL